MHYFIPPRWSTAMPCRLHRLHQLCAAGLLLPLLAGTARADEQASTAPTENATGAYATLGLGGAWPQDVSGNTAVIGIPVNGSYSLNGGFAGEVGVGYDFGPVRSELTYTYANANLTSLSVSALGVNLGSASVSNGAVSTNSLLVSAYVDIPTKSRWVPYLGGGVGYTNVGWGAYSVSGFGATATQTAGSQGVFGYQAKLGLSYLASKKADVFVEGTYQGAAGFSVSGVNYDSLSSWGARLGARYRF